MTDVSIIIIEYFSLDEIDIFLKNIEKSIADIACEIIVSSNSCYSFKEQKNIERKYHNAKWVFNEKNGGFSYGMNRGLEKAKGRYLIISNPDTKIKQGLPEMVQFLEYNKKIGALGPQIVDKNNKIQDSCRKYVSLPSFIMRHLKRFLGKNRIVYEKKIDYSKTQVVDWVIGAFIMVRREAYEKTHGLDERFFMYAEDVDWCYRIREAGYEIGYYPEAIVEYEGSRAARKEKKYMKIFINSHLLLWYRHGLLKPKLKTKHKMHLFNQAYEVS